MMKKILSILLSVCMLAFPFQGTIAFAADNAPDVAVSGGLAPIIYFNIPHLATVSSDTAITVNVTAQDGATVASTAIRLEGLLLGTDYLPFSFTPAGCGLADGAMYTVVVEATDSNGLVSVTPLTFHVDNSVDADYTVKNGAITAEDGATLSLHAATPLDFTAGYGTNADGTIDHSAVNAYTDAVTYQLQYDDKPVEVSSASGIPYQTFDVDLGGKTTGEVAVAYSGYTKIGERMALKVFNPVTAAWDVIDTFTGEGSVSASLDVATYGTNGNMHLAATLDYVTNGADSMIWMTDPQHYTKFADLNEYYYKIYKYAAQEFQAGNIGYIMNSGDLVDDIPSAAVAPSQWQIASTAVGYAEAVTLPHGLVTGNHDVNTFTSADYSKTNPVDYSLFKQTFPASRFNSERWYGGSLNNNTSHYDLVTIGNVDFIVLFLGYGLEATDETIAWANQALRTYSHRTAIVVTHEYLDSQTAVRADTGRGEMIYQHIVDPNPNVKMVLCGHDDGALCLERTASDGRTYYELLSDYQFVEAEPDEFYANEHYIGTVPECCGDGYIRIMTIDGDCLSSVTYSPVTKRYNPYGDRESFTIDLNTGTADRTFATTAFSAAVVGDEVDTATGDTIGVITKNGNTTYTTVCYAAVPDAPYTEEPLGSVWPADADYGVAATPDAPYYQHCAVTAPAVAQKIDLLSAFGYGETPVITAWTPFNSDLGLSIDLNKTPYLYYSFAMEEGANFTFSFLSDVGNAPFLLFRDATGDGAFFNRGSSVWDTYQNREQFTLGSETGCIDMRALTNDPADRSWIINRMTSYNSTGKNVVFSYLFLGSAPVSSGLRGDNTPNDLAALTVLLSDAQSMNTDGYTAASVTAFNNAVAAASAVDKTDADAVSDAYAALAAAKGGLTKTVYTLDPAKLTSLYTYNLTASKWKDLDTGVSLPSSKAWLSATQTATGGLAIKRSSLCTHTWPGMAFDTDYTLYPTGDKIYLCLDVDADSCWSINVTASQGDLSDVVIRFNQEINNSFNKENADSQEGVFRGVYDVTESFVRSGFDVSKDILITHTIFYAVPGTVTVERIEFFGDPVPTTDPASSLLPTKLSAWNENNDGQSTTVSFDADGNTVVENTCDSWGGMIAAVSPAQVVTTADHAISLDISVANQTNIMLNMNGTDISLSKYIDAAKTNSSDDLSAGNYTVTIPLAAIAELNGSAVTKVTNIIVFSVGPNGNNAVTVRKLRLAEYTDYAWDYHYTDFGTAATPADPYHQHAAVNAPEVAQKIDLMAMMGFDGPTAVTKNVSYGNFVMDYTIDLSKTPYLYYSFAQPKGVNTNFNFAFHTDMSTTPYLLFRDATKSGAALNSGAANWDSYTQREHYPTTSETGCIDMRQYLNSGAASAITLDQITFYNSKGAEVIVSYFFFGSEPLYVEEFDATLNAMLGDVNDDGEVTTIDARDVLEAIITSPDAFDERQKYVADYNGDGQITTSDVRAILLFIVQNA